MSSITTHVLDTARGKPAAGIAVRLESQGDGWEALGEGVTDHDGRIRNLLTADHQLAVGYYRLTFEIATYFEGLSQESFYPSVSILFEIKDPHQHYHVPLLLSPYGYSTYRGS